MSDGLDEFFSSTKSGQSKKPPSSDPALDDFYDGKPIKLPDAPVVDRQRTAHQQGYGRGGRAPTPQEMARRRAAVDADIAGIKNTAIAAYEDPVGTAAAGAAGFNRGVMYLMGLPVDTAANLVDLAGAGYGTARSLITGEDPSELYQPFNRGQVPGAGEWFARKLDEGTEAIGMGPVTQNPRPDNPAARLAFNTGMAVPGALTGRQVVASSAGGVAQGVVAEAGGDPAMQAVAGMMGGHAVDSGVPGGAARRPSEPSPQDLLNEQAAKQSGGAAGAAVDLQKLSPDLRAAVEEAVRQTGGAVNPEVLARQIQADSLPVKVRLSEGQALGDERLISLELNARGKSETYSKGFAQQNKDLIENLRVMRDEIGPDVFTTNQVEHADTLINRYKAIDDARRAEITAKYKALEEANGGQFPVNGSAFVSAADVALSKKMKGRYLPAQIRGDLEEFRDNAGFMTFEQFENLRTNLAAEARKAERSGDGNAAAAINIVRRELEALPMEGDVANLKQLADDARAAAKARFDALDADPAYKAAVNDSVTPDAFVQKYVIAGARDNVELLAAAMADDPAAAQTLKVATLEHLRKSAGIDTGYNGNFTQAGYNKALQGLEPKLAFLLDPKAAETARNLGDVARYTQFQPRGSWVNNSNTDVAAAAREYGMDVLEGALNAKTLGIPIASNIRAKMNQSKIEKQAAKTFAPGAGLTRLSDLSKLEKKE